jgi:hypothetical protein
MLGGKFSARGGEVKHVDGGLPFRVDQGDVDVAGLVRESGTDAVQQTGLVLGHDLDQCAVRRALIVELNLRRCLDSCGLIFLDLEALAQHPLEVPFP